jgi:hypothetical protein
MNPLFPKKNQALEAASEALALCLLAQPSGLPAALPVDPWVAASGLQKAIRRGDAAVALACAATLLHHQREREVPMFGFPLEDVFENRAAEFSERAWDQMTSLAERLGPERRNRLIRIARARRNCRGAAE